MNIDEILKAQKEYFLTGATLPVEFRKELDILSDDRQWVEIFLLEDGMFIKKKEFQ